MDTQTFTMPSDNEMTAIRRLFRGWGIKSILRLAKSGDADAIGCLGRVLAAAKRVASLSGKKDGEGKP